MTDAQKKHNKDLAKALESGKYKQCTDRLRDDDTFCCLGVACDLFQKATGTGKWSHDDRFYIGLDYHTFTPPSEVMTYYGWDIANPSISVNGQWQTASIRNDQGESFKTIAKGFRKAAEDGRCL